MTLNPFMGMNREQLDHTRVILQLAAALGSFEAAFEALDQCTGDEQVDIKLWELSTPELDKLAETAERIQSAGGGDQVQEALRRRSSMDDDVEKQCQRDDEQCQRDSEPDEDEDRPAD